MTAPKSTPTDQAARDLIGKTGLDQTLFVEAGAGSGKTTQLVDRIVSLVTTGGVSLANIAAITFTEAAAAELRARIRVELEQGEQDADLDPEARARCRVALEETDLAAISTLHGFAFRLLAEFAVKAELPPRVSVLDEASSQLAAEQRWERFVDRLYAEAVDEKRLETLLTYARLLDVPLEQRYAGQATLKDVAAELNQNWDRIGALVERKPADLAPPDFTEFEAAVAAVEALPARCTDPDDVFYERLVEKRIPEMQRFRDIEDTGTKLSTMMLLGETQWGPGTGGRKANWDDDLVGAKATLARAPRAVENLLASVAQNVLDELLTLTAADVAEAAAERQAAGALEFHDLLVLARQMLRTNPSARQALHQRYTHLLLDEFQDTDPIQIELAVLIASATVLDEADGGQTEAPGWDDLAVADGRLFFVGDPKQSIYRFRRADIALFLRARDRFGASAGGPQNLTTNFRTVEPILAWVNDLFSSIMNDPKAEAARQQPLYERLTPWRTVAPNAEHRPVMLGGVHPDEEVKADELRKAEAVDVAAAIAHIGAHPDQWPVADKEPSASDWRPARLDDVTILVPTRTSVPFLREALDEMSIPYRLATGTLVYGTQEIRDAMSALRAIDDPTDELSLVAALRSPLYGCSDVELFEFHHKVRRWDLRQSPDDRPDSVADDHRVSLALAHLRTLWEDRRWTGPADLLERLLRERNAALLAFGDRRHTEVWRRLRFLTDQARAFEETVGGSLRDFLAWVDIRSEGRAAVHEPVLPETDVEAVQIMTIHGAKGLEFPITVLSGMTTKPGTRRPGVSVLWGDSGPPEVRVKGNIATASHEVRADIEAEMDLHEKMRLLYVATTRAEDHLLVSCRRKKSHGYTPVASKSTYAETMWGRFGADHSGWRPSPVAEEVDRYLSRTSSDASISDFVLFPPDQTVVGPNGSVPPVLAAADAAALASEREDWIARRSDLLDGQRSSRFTSATRLAQLGRPSSEGDDVVDKDDDGADQAETEPMVARRRGRAGSAIGTATHAVLQVVDLVDPSDIAGHVRRQCEAESIPDEVETVDKLVRSALDSSTVRMATSLPHHKEIFVASPVGARAIEGYVDLLIEGPDGLIVVDYKTDSANTEAEIDAKLAAYELQGAAYAVALEQATGEPVVECRFVFCNTRGAIERSVADLPAAKARIRELAK